MTSTLSFYPFWVGLTVRPGEPEKGKIIVRVGDVSLVVMCLHPPEMALRAI